MDEEKAAAYYEEMLRKGGGAAKLKQGLGYGSNSPRASSAAAFPSFVRGGNYEESFTKIEKEITLAAVRDKLKRGRLAKYESSDEEPVRRRSNRGSPFAGHKSDSRRTARDSRSPSPTRSRCRGRESSSRSGKRHRRDRRSDSSSSCDADRRRRDYTSDCRSLSRSPSSDKKGSYKRERTKKDISLRARRRPRSPSYSSRRSKSMSPGDRHRHSHQQLCQDGYFQRSTTDMKDRQRKIDSKNMAVSKPSPLDYAKLIPGFETMSPAEKVKEKMRLQLSDAVSKDAAKGFDADCWERFTFNKSAPLDDDAKLDDFGDGTGAQDDTKFLQHTGSSFLSTNSSQLQAKREAQIQAAHDAAIFGPLLGMSKEPSSVVESDASPIKEASEGDILTAKVGGASPKNSLLSDQISTFQQGSWRERALRLKQQRAGNTVE